MMRRKLQRNRRNGRNRRIRRIRRNWKICDTIVKSIVFLGIAAGMFTAVIQKCGTNVPAQEFQSGMWEIMYSDGNETDKEAVSDGVLTSSNPEETDPIILDEKVCRDCRQIYEKDPKLCVLVNKEKELDAAFDSHLRSICGGRLMASDWMYQDLKEMLQAAGDAGYDYWIASAYRSRERQQELVDEDVEALMRQGKSRQEALEETLRETMPAGHSEHETGLALDILCSGNTNMDESQALEPANQWLVSHCSEYGFILRYPKDKVSVTGIAWEPWHFRYVGRDAAKYMTEHDLTLEEFCMMVRKKNVNYRP